MSASSSSGGDPSALVASLRASLRAALWSHRDSLDTLRDAICAFAADLHEKGMVTSDIAAMVRAVVAELREDGEQLAAELAQTDPSLDQTVTWCLEFGPDFQRRPRPGEGGGIGRDGVR